MNRLSDIYARQRYYDEAINAAESSLAVRRELDDQFGIASSLISIADIASQRGDYTRALQHAMQAYDIGTDIDSERITVPALIRIARAETRLGDPESAAARYAEVESIAKLTEDPHNVFRARLGMADTKIELGLYDGIRQRAAIRTPCNYSKRRLPLLKKSTTASYCRHCISGLQRNISQSGMPTQQLNMLRSPPVNDPRMPTA